MYLVLFHKDVNTIFFILAAFGALPETASFASPFATIDLEMDNLA